MIAYYIALVTLPVWAAALAYVVARSLGALAHVAADRLTGRGVR